MMYKFILPILVLVLIGYCVYLHSENKRLRTIQDTQERIFLEVSDSLQYYREKYNPEYQM
ncbi:MAG: hypothetical protein Q4A00_06925 [Flavobacteriaceae bacterium]|nr:hypothetical protein [Flavobacteriaceae bacterium]